MKIAEVVGVAEKEWTICSWSFFTLCVIPKKHCEIDAPFSCDGYVIAPPWMACASIEIAGTKTFSRTLRILRHHCRIILQHPLYEKIKGDGGWETMERLVLNRIPRQTDLRFVPTTFHWKRFNVSPLKSGGYLVSYQRAQAKTSLKLRFFSCQSWVLRLKGQ